MGNLVVPPGPLMLKICGCRDTGDDVYDQRSETEC
jgi:hypothetical protein